ncbi:TIGR03985 family CRISPR-associated protein [Cronbergia sp. UHCC 0137]|uniref:TIGR03985 family CRISPR-associated protein n=1 Tax=Cronbergia sp. UHCC 0137 TaxID=3110239 RepID=UPI002B1EEB32|nr:TIGR03985 family CRISPR-associated protein [Cronbergia sp. UHCC 0137]MEA5620756.1 TIGR03985 family CRISPR-associated protein [Cronbergia sp. UHCC 0137]
MNLFPYSPTPQTLHWLAAGQLTNRFQRSLRLWVLLDKLYGSQTLAHDLTHIFTYSQLRDRLFAQEHPQSEQLTAQEIPLQCADLTCICHQTCWQILQKSNSILSLAEWEQEILPLGITPKQLQTQLQESPFATVHRSLRDDLKYLVKQGWLLRTSPGHYTLRPSQELPQPPANHNFSPGFSQLSESQTWELLRVLESISFVQPNLELVTRNLWEQMTLNSSSQKRTAEPQQRIFLHLDYILPDDVQDRVDTYQEQIEQLWQRPPGGVVQFETWIPLEQRKVQVTVYPVCLHYLRRAKYLSAYGIDPDGNFGWHNYRLDRIVDSQLKILAWGDPLVPKPLKKLWYTGQLPQPEYVKQQLDIAWGFNFYLPRELLILRFSADFAHWYVDNTVRHPTFKPVAYQQLAKVITNSVKSPAEQQQILEIIQQRNKNDRYYQGWIRTGDINVLMRLRDWRPKGEVIAPLTVRQGLKEEAIQELSHYSL